MKLTFTVLGKPEPGGSKRAFIVKGRAVVTDANKHAGNWKQQARHAAATVMQGELWRGPVKLTAHFFFARPRSHFTSKGELRKGLATAHTQKPDLLKCTRLLEDALTGVVYVDDAQITIEDLGKWWSIREAGVRVQVEEL